MDYMGELWFVGGTKGVFQYTGEYVHQYKIELILKQSEHLHCVKSQSFGADAPLTLDFNSYHYTI